MEAVCNLIPTSDIFCRQTKKEFSTFGNDKTKFSEYQGKKFVHQLICLLPNCNRFRWIFIDEQSKVVIYGGENMNLRPLSGESGLFYSKSPLLIHAIGIKSKADIPRWLTDTFEELNRSYVNPEITRAFISKYGIDRVTHDEGIRYTFEK